MHRYLYSDTPNLTVSKLNNFQEDKGVKSQNNWSRGELNKESFGKGSLI